MMLLKSSALFFLSLVILLAASFYYKTFEWVCTYAGWFMVIGYLASSLSKLLISYLPRKTVTPKDKAVLITGCDSGFGHSLVQRLDSLGYTVFAGCLEVDGEGAEELRKTCSSSLHIIPLDVTKHDHVQAAFKEVVSHLQDKELWALVNNAGVAIFSEIEWCSMSVIEHMFNVNVLGAVRVTKTFLPLLRRSKGRVIVMASVAGHVTYPGFLSYSMTKHALVSFADGLRREMRKWGVAVATIEPTMYRTRIARSDVLTCALDNSWQKTPEPIKEAYGFPYYQDFRGRMQKLAGKARPYLDEVVNCMESAITELNPHLTYTCAGPADKMRLWIMSVLPVPFLDFLICHIIQPSHRQLSNGGKNS